MSNSNMSLDNFKAAMSEGGVRPNLFRVDGSIGPSGSGNNGSSTDSSMRFLIKSAVIPADNISPILVPFLGTKLPIAGDKEFEPWTISVLMADYKLREKFEKWSDSIKSNKGNIASTSDYFADWTVKSLDRKGNVIAEYKMVGCWPSNIGQIQLGFENENQVGEFEVTLQYCYWVNDKTTT